MRWRKRRKKYKDIAPDEIFLDSRNAPRFDTHQLEGRLEKPINKKAPFFVLMVFFLITITFSFRLFALQIKEGEAYIERSENNSLRHEILFADRGIIYDRNGDKLVWNEPNPEGEYSLRRYSSLDGLSHILGYISYPQKDAKGIFYENAYTPKTGIEKTFNDLIAGTNGIKITEKDVGGDIVTESSISEPVTGDDLILSIDAEVQQRLYQSIRDLAERVDFEAGAGVIMDIYTGEIIALTSYPEYSSQILTDGVEKEMIASYVESEYEPFLNRATNGLYTPGSIVKPFVAVGALNEGLITPQTTIMSTGSIRVENPYNRELFSIFTDWKAHGLVKVRDAISVSSNIFFYEIGGGFKDQKGLGISRLETYLRAFGIAEKTGVYGIDEVHGLIPNPEWKKNTFEDGEWRVGDTYNTSIGQYGFQVTALQMVRAVAALANNGTLVTPKLTVSGSTDSHPLPIAIETKHLQVAREGMRQSVETGISQGLKLPYVQVAAKTGTAELGSRKQYVNSWVTGFFPYEKPRYSFAVVMERGPHANLTGAIFVMRGVLEWMYQNAPEYLE